MIIVQKVLRVNSELAKRLMEDTKKTVRQEELTGIKKVFFR